MAKAGAQAMRDTLHGPGDGLEVPLGATGQLARLQVSAAADPHEPAPLSMILETLASLRAGGQLLLASEWAAYEAAIESGRCVITEHSIELIHSALMHVVHDRMTSQDWTSRCSATKQRWQAQA